MRMKYRTVVMISPVLIKRAAEATIAARRLRSGKLFLLPLEIMARTRATEPNIYGRTTGKVKVEKIARTARLIEVLVSLSKGDSVIIVVLLNSTTYM